MAREDQLRTTARTLQDLGWSQILDALASRTQTPRGRELALALSFKDGRAQVQASLDIIEEARQLLRRQLPMPVGGLQDIRLLVDRAQKGAILNAPELQQCAQVARGAGQVRRFVTGLAEDVPLLAGWAQRLTNLGPLASRIDGCLEPSGTLRDDASVELAEHRARARSLHTRIKSQLQERLEQPEFLHLLQDNYYSVRNDRYVVPVKANFRSQVPGIVHNASQSGQTIFVEMDELVPLGNELTIAQSLAAEEELRVLGELSEEVANYGDALLKNAEVLADLDLVQASGRLAEDLDCAPPQLVEPTEPLALLDARHPLLLLQGKKVIANTIELRDNQWALVISGPNAGGKTVAMTTVGLCTLMTWAGLPVPARIGSVVPLVRGLSCSVGDAQDLHRDLSTFTAHLTAISDILHHAGPGWLALVDEIAGGTDPVEGAAIATATLEYLVERQVRVMVTTHLEAVKAYGVTDPRFVNGRVGLDPHTLRPTFHLELGVAGVSKAIEVAAQVGLPTAVVEKAKEHLAGGGALTVAIAKLEQAQVEARQERDRLAREVARLEGEKRALEEAQREARRARAQAELDLRQEMEAKLREAEALAAKAVAELQAGADMKRAQAMQAELRRRAEEERRAKQRLEAQQQAPQARALHSVSVGDWVHVVTLGQRGEVTAVQGDDVEVRVGALRTRVRLEDLVAARKPEGQGPGKPGGDKRKSKRKHTDTAELAPTGERGRDWITQDATCDLRGLRAEEAQRMITAFLDERYLTGPHVVLFIHGHGTGALRQVVREALVESPVVQSFRPGEQREGGEGVTIAELRTD